MITKERLEELIKQGATICNAYIDYDDNICYRFGKVFIVDTDTDKKHFIFKVNGTNTTVIMYNTKYLFETEEDARWDLEMTRTRTEKFKPPTWEEFFNKPLWFEDNDVKFLTKDNKEVRFFKTCFSKIVVMRDIETLFNKSLTKENYIEACKLCLKLFEGEEV